MNELDNAVDALENFATGSALDAADGLARAFELTGDRISTALEGAARRGEFSFNTLANSIAQDLGRLAVDQLITGPLTDLLGGALGGISDGQSGGGATRNTTVNLNVSGVNNSQGLSQSQGQISSAVARAVASGQRYI